MKEIYTARLIIKPLSMEHCTEQYVSWLNDPEVFQYLETKGGYNIDLLKSYIEHIVDAKILMWGIHLKQDRLHIGNIKIDPIDPATKSGEYGILMGEKNHWGKGYAKEASDAIIEYCFCDEPNLEKVTLGVVGENRRAVDLYRRMGFVEEAVLENHTLKDGKYLDVIRMTIFNKKHTN